MPSKPAIPLIPSIAPLAATCDVWFLDIWGVLHNGVRPFASTVAACQRFRAGGGTVLLVSNAPRPFDSVVTQLARIGVADDAYDAIITSGDVSRSLIAAHAGARVLHIGPERDAPIFAGLGVQTGADAATAEVAVCTGLYDDETETAADYAALLAALHARNVPMVCANPDLKVERGGRIIYCAGAVAQAYAALGGRVDYAGKPYLPIYDMALARAGGLRGADVAKDRVLAIGDGVGTDIAGAAVFGIRSVYVASGVHVSPGETLEAAALRLFPHPSAGAPVAVMAQLAW